MRGISRTAPLLPLGSVLVLAVVLVDFSSSEATEVTPPATILSPGESQAGDSAHAHPGERTSAGASERLEVPPPPFSDGIFPCSGCHADLEVNRRRRELTDFHTDIELKHDEQHRWCLDCHDATERDSLHLASGERVSFDESYLLCGQCHGEKLRDWRAGVHGRRTGDWNGHKQYLLCAHCHNPHQPKFRPIAPMPPPRPPRRPGA